MPVVKTGTFAFWGHVFSTSGGWSIGASTSQLLAPSGGSALGTLNFVFGTSDPFQLDSSPPITLGAVPPGFTPGIGLAFTIRTASSISTSSVTDSGDAAGVIGSNDTWSNSSNPNLIYSRAIPDNTSFVILQSSASFIADIVNTPGIANSLTLNNSSAGMDGSTLAPIKIQGNYSLIEYWWVLPSTDACGNAQTPHLTLGESTTTPPGPGNYALLDPVHPDTTSPTVVIDSIEPNNGLLAGGTAVTVRGSGFGDGATITFDGITATSIVVVSSGEITCVTPAHAAGSVNVLVTNLDASQNATPGTFTYAARVVQITAVTPNSGPTAGGTAVVITGQGFLTGVSVTFGGFAASAITVVDSSRITCNTPAVGAGAVSVVVTNTDASTATMTTAFTYQNANPSISVAYRSSGVGQTRGMRRANTPPKIHQELGQPSTFQFTAPFQLDGKSFISFAFQGQVLFAGLVSKSTARTEGRTKQIVWDSVATDFWQLLACAYPSGSWENVTATTVLTALMATAVGFSSSIELALPPVTEKFTGTTDLVTAIKKVCDDAGASAFLDTNKTLHVFSSDPAFDPPGAVTEGNPDLIYPNGEDAVTIEWDYSQIHNHIVVYGANGLTYSQDNSSSIAEFGLIPFVISDTSLTTVAAMVSAATNELNHSALPIPTVKYATRDLKTMAGKKVVVSVTHPAIAGSFIIHTVDIDQFEIDRTLTTKPRFKVTAKPANAPMMRSTGSIPGLLQTTVNLQQQLNTSPPLSGAITADRGGPTVIPASSITNSQLAGCIDGSSKLTDASVSSAKLAPTGVLAGTYGG